MIDALKTVLIIMISFSGGLVISSAIFAFIALIGVVPSISYKTKTTENIILYEECIIFGGIFGTLETFIEYKFLIGNNVIGIIFVVFFSLCIGIFVGVLASSIAESINAIPIFSNKTKLEYHVGLFMIVISLGKLVGSVLYFINSGFRV